VQLVGQCVQAWTSANGVYTGTLVEVTSDRPWRGRVLVDGVIEPAQAWDAKREAAPRRGFRPGETIEVGGQSVKAHLEQGGSYRDALARDLEKLQALKERGDGRDAWWLDRAIAVRIEQLAVEAV
jgi:hypothetical protein